MDLTFISEEQKRARISFANNMLKLYLKFVKHKFSKLVMGKERLIHFLEFKGNSVIKGSLTVWALYAYFSASQNAASELLVWCM